MVYEKISPSSYLKLPYFEFMMMVDEWIEKIENDKKQRDEEMKRSEMERKKMESSMKNNNRRK